jgi:hypothetical protein
MDNQERIFADGFIIKRRENAPEFVIGNLSVKVDEAIAFLKKYEKKGWVNLSIKKGRSGNPYIELDTFEAKPKGDTGETVSKSAAPPPPVDPEEDGDLPF